MHAAEKYRIRSGYLLNEEEGIKDSKILTNLKQREHEEKSET